jgi:hypothetical protein
MPLPVIADVYRVTFNWSDTASDEDVVSVQHFRGSGTAEELATALDGTYQTHMLEGFPDSLHVDSVDILALDGVSATQTFPLTEWDGESGSGETLPGFNILIEGQTGLRGSANRGRWFLPGPLESVITDGLLDPANQAEIQTAWDDFRTAMALADFEWGVASYTTPSFNPYISVSVPRMLGVIRRRRNVS